MRKRQKFILSSVILMLGLVFIHNFSLDLRYWFILLLGLVTWFLSVWSLREGLNGIEWFVVPLPTVILSLGVGLFYILLPTSWLYKSIIVVVFGLCQYFLLLTENIFSVSAIRTIALLWTAHVFGMVMMLVSGWLLFNTILSFRLSFFEIGFLVSLVSFFLYFPTLWSVKLEPNISGTLVVYTVALSLACGALSVVLSFLPMNFSVEALFLVTYMYVTSGVVQNHLQERLNARAVWEYVVWGGTVMITALVKTLF